VADDRLHIGRLRDLPQPHRARRDAQRHGHPPAAERGQPLPEAGRRVRSGGATRRPTALNPPRSARCGSASPGSAPPR
jgi:hypothetical protein